MGVINCERSVTAQYIHMVGANDSSRRMRLFELKAFSDPDIGRNIAQVTPNASWDNDPLKCTIGDIRPENVNKSTTFS